MESLSIGQIVLVNFPFSDLTRQKLRPCLVIGLAEFGDVLVCQITSKRYSSRRAISLTKKDFQSGSLIVDSFIRPDKIATLEQDMMLQILGTLKTSKIGQVKTAVKKILEIP